MKRKTGAINRNRISVIDLWRQFLECMSWTLDLTLHCLIRVRGEVAKLAAHFIVVQLLI